MRDLRNGGRVVLLCACLMSYQATGQKLVWKDSVVLVTLKTLADQGTSLVKFRLTQDMEYSFTCSNLLFVNWQHDNNTNQASFLQHLKCRSQFNNESNFKIITSFVHDLGIQYFLDSITRFQPDENTLDIKAEIWLMKNISGTVFSNLTTRLFNAYDYTTDQAGNLLKTMYSSFLTPLIWTISAGFGLTFPRFAKLSTGLTAAKFTWIRDKGIFKRLDVTEFYGVPKEKNYLFEYGLSMHLIIDRDLLKRVHWDCDVLVFKNNEKPVDLIMKNLVGIRINKFLKTSIQTRVLYEEEVSKNLQVENMISIGFYFNL